MKKIGFIVNTIVSMIVSAGALAGGTYFFIITIMGWYFRGIEPSDWQVLYASLGAIVISLCMLVDNMEEKKTQYDVDYKPDVRTEEEFYEKYKDLSSISI